MRIRPFFVCAAAVLLLLAWGSSSVNALPYYVGGLASEGTIAGLMGTGVWVTPGPTMFGWTVVQDSSGYWNYTYSGGAPNAPAADPVGSTASVILQCSPSLTAADFFGITGDFTSYSVGWFQPDPSQPTLPGPIYGIKFDGVSGITPAANFECWEAPVWGNCYAVSDNLTDSFWNVSFLDQQPTDPPSNGSVTNHILTPGTPVPDASTLVLAASGLAPTAMLLRRRVSREDK